MGETTAPSAQANAQNDTDSNCVGSTTTFDPPIALYTYDHLKDNEEDLYAGDVEVADFLANIIHPVAEAAYGDYKDKMFVFYGLSSRFFRTSKSEYIRIYKRDFIAKSDQEHIDSWKNIVEWTSASNYFSQQLEPVVLDFVNKATTESIRYPIEITDVRSRKTFCHARVNDAVSLHDNLVGGRDDVGKRNLFNIRTHIVKDIKSHGSSISSYKTTEDKTNIVNLVTLNDSLSGLGILFNGTMGYKIEVISYTCLGPGKGEVQYRYNIYDHFGLDKQDVNMNDIRPHMGTVLDTTLGSRQSFLSWFYLQRVKGYKPIVSKVFNEYTVSTEYNHTKYIK